MKSILKHTSGSSIIISVSVSALVIAAALSVSIAIVAAARNSASTSSANKAFFAAEAGLESAIYSLINTAPGTEPEITTPEGWNSKFQVDIDNKIDEAFDTDPTIIQIPANNSVAILLYTGDDTDDILNLTHIQLELTVDQGYTDEVEANYYRNLEADYVVNDIVNDYIDQSVDFLYPNLGRQLDAPTINLYNSSSETETWSAGNDIYQQVTAQYWCKIHPSGFTDLEDGEKWWAGLDPSEDTTLCTNSFADLHSTPINNLKTDSYPRDPGDLYASDYALYGPEAVFYLDNDQNGMVSIANLTKFTLLSAESSVAYERELAIADYDETTHIYTFSGSDNFIKKEDGSILPINDILSQVNQPLLVISTYRIPLTLHLGLSDTAPENYFIPAIQTLISSTGQRGVNSQKLEGIIRFNNKIPVLNQTIVY